MKKNMCKNLAPFFFLLIFFASSAASAFAAPPQKPDLRVQLVGPTSAVVNSPYVYTVKVKNIGNKTASGVQLVVTFPETDTSPQKYILGTLSGIQTGCQVVNRKLQCSLNSITPNQTKNVTFNLALPVSTKALEIKANATTTTLPGDPNMSNNTDTLVPPLAYPTNQLTSATVLASHCTGQGLTSYFECELFPSSISYFTMTLNAGGSITVSEPGYTGQWDQFTSPQQLHFTITDGYGNGAEFNGYATSTTCFEGMTTFIPASNYISPYKVCIQ